MKKKKIKFRIAHLLDKFPQLCWTNLVLWAELDAPFKDVFNQECRKSNKGTPYAYCMKCETTGRFNDLKAKR